MFNGILKTQNIVISTCVPEKVHIIHLFIHVFIYIRYANESVIEKDSVKETTIFYSLFLVLKDRNFHLKILSKFYRYSKLNFLANFNFVLAAS